jgi:hypothetical protein
MRRSPALRSLVAAVPAAVALLLVLASAASAARDQIVITGSADVPPRQTVGSVVVLDGPITVLGHATGDVVAVHGRVLVTGRVDGDVLAVSRTIDLGPRARVGGDVHYGGSRPRIAPGAQVAGTVSKENWDDVAGPAWGATARWIWWIAVSISALVLGLLLLWFAPRAAEAVLVAFREAPGATIGWGIALIIGLPILAVIALVTLVGIPLGIGLLLALLPLLAIGYVYACWMLGRTLVKPPRGRALAFLAGWGILRILALIPIVGGIVGILATAAGLGAATVAAWRSRGGIVSAPRPAAP